MKFEEAISPTLYNVHYYIPTKRQTLINKAWNKKSKIRKPGLDRAAANADLTIENIAVPTGVTKASDVQGIPKRFEYVDEYGKRKKIVRRKFPRRRKI